MGDSRAYLWDSQSTELSQLSQDHSVVAELVNKGLITPEQTEKHPDKNVITQSLGVSRKMILDVGVHRGVLLPHQQLLLCSDGLTDELTEERSNNC